MSNRCPKHQALIARTARATTEQLWGALALLPPQPTNPEESLVRSALIEVLEGRLPAVKAYMDKFYDLPEDSELWAVPYSSAMLLAREELGSDAA